MTGVFGTGTAVTMFCGGRGSATLARELVAQPDVTLSLVVNGYDNGLSTGALRRYLPGMLGASDFRKNLRHHLDPADPADAALLQLLDYRFPAGTGAAHLRRLLADLVPGRPSTPHDGWCRVEDLRPTQRAAIAADLAAFADHDDAAPFRLDLADCSLANLVLAGAFLRHGRDFNAAVAAVAATVGSPIRLLNVSPGTNAYLVALTEDGGLLADEADIVAPQGPARIRELFLLPEPVDPASVAGRTVAERSAWLRARSTTVPVDPATAAAVADADLLVYGPGTPHSSLLPTYLTAGLAERVRASRAAAKVFVVNIVKDHDARRLDATDLLDRTLATLGDPDNAARTVTHVVYPHRRRRGVDAPEVPPEVAETGWYRGCRWVAADLEHGVHSGVHDGPRTVALLADLLREAGRSVEHA